MSSPEDVIKICQRIKEEGQGRVHMVGIGNGVSVDMIKRGAEYGGGFHMFIYNDMLIKKQMVGLLSSVVIPMLKNVEIVYDKELVEEVKTNFEAGGINRA